MKCINSSVPNEYRNQCNTVINNRTSILTTSHPLATHTNSAHGYECISHSMPENKAYGGNSHSTHHAYQGLQMRRHYYHRELFRSSHTDCDQQGFHHRGSLRSSNWFHNSYLCEYSNNVFHTLDATVNNLKATQNTI